jgi:hypothetical protein
MNERNKKIQNPQNALGHAPAPQMKLRPQKTMPNQQYLNIVQFLISI